jgi:hypothetical protein
MVTSPVRGIVKQMLVNTIGGVIQPGSDIAEVVSCRWTTPAGSQDPPADIAFLHPARKRCQIHRLRLHHLRRALQSELEIGADTVTDEDKKNTFYMIKLRTDAATWAPTTSPADHPRHGGLCGHHHRQEEHLELPAQTDHQIPRRGHARALIGAFGCRRNE